MIKPCPFCGSDDVKLVPAPGVLKWHHVCCMSCGASVGSEESWNTRADGWIAVGDRFPEEEGEYQVWPYGRTSMFSYFAGSSTKGMFDCNYPVTHYRKIDPPRTDDE
jgi:hypothetical protein